MALSLEVRRAIIRAHDKQHLTYEEIADLLGVGRASVSRVLRLHRESGSVERRPPGGGNFSPLHGEVLELLMALVAAMPDATVQELTDALVEQKAIETSRAAVGRALNRVGYSRKKRRLSPSSATPPSAASTD